MKIEGTLRLLCEHFTAVSDAGGDVFRAERLHHGKPLGVFYFDLSEAILQGNFDLKAYSQERIAPDFYRHEGSLQWNYYLYFVLERAGFEQLRATTRITEVESDRTYSRKFVRDRETLHAELAAPLMELLGSTAPQQDLASIWTEKLTKAGLSRVADPSAPYVPTVRDFIAGKSVAWATPQANGTTPAPGRFIQSLQLDRFRDHPVQRTFALGTVNLVRGVNGSGKTSLLEAIELSICGGIRRQDGQRPSNSKIEVQYVGQARPEVCPSADAAVYRARDLHWYGGYYRQGNELCHNFGRFNFFDSDAAFRLSSATNNVQIVDALDSLLLGERATSIEERMKQFQDRFSQQERDLRRLRTKYEQDRAKANQQLEELKAIKDTREVLSRELQIKGTACGWGKLPSKFTMDELAALQEDVEDLAAQLLQHVERLPWFARVSISALNREAKQLEETVKALAEQRKLAKAVRTAVEQADARIVDGEAKLELLRRLGEFHAQPDGISLEGMGTAIKESRARAAQHKEAATLLRGLDLAKYADSSVPLADLVSQNTADTAKRRRALSKLSNRAAELQTQLGALKTVVQEIKGLGQRFCQLRYAQHVPHLIE